MDKASKNAQAATCSLNTMKKRYAARAAAYLSLGAALTAVYSFSGLGLGAAAVPFAAAALCAGFWALFARLVLCRVPHLLHKEFTQPVLWALSVPVWMGAACLMLTLPVSFSSDAEEAVAISIMLLEAVLLAPAAVLAALVLGVLAVIKAAKHLGTAQGHARLYRASACRQHHRPVCHCGHGGTGRVEHFALNVGKEARPC